MGTLEDRALEECVAEEAEALVERAVAAVVTAVPMAESEMRGLPAVRATLTAANEIRRDCLLALAPRLVGDQTRHTYDVRRLFGITARARLPLTAPDVFYLLAWIRATATEPYDSWGDAFSTTDLVKAIVKQVEASAPSWSQADRAELAPLIDAVAAATRDYPTKRRLRRLVRTHEGLPLEVIPTGDDAAGRLGSVFTFSAEQPAVLAQALEVLASYPKEGRPSRTWLSSLDALRMALEHPAALAAELLDALLSASDTERVYTYRGRSYPTIHFLGPTNDRFACAVATFAGAVSDPSLLPRLRRLAVKSVTFIGGSYGSPRSLRLANACAQAIAHVAAPSSITELLALERSVRHGGLLREIRKAIDVLAKTQGLTRDGLLERSVEDHGLGRDGRSLLPLTQGSALIEVDGTSAKLAYIDEKGARKTSFPPDLRGVDAEPLADMRQKRKAITKTLAGERHRLETLMRLDRRWQLTDWRQLYLDHPITGQLTRTLIWGFRGADGSDVLGIPLDETTVITNSGHRARIPPHAEVRLWHPIHAASEDVHAWRLYLLRALVVQPFKQAFRELYLLTPAEAETELYSNRFAGHVFGQSQARALMKRRGWKPTLVAPWDEDMNPGVARREFETFAVRAEFFYDPVASSGGDADHYPYCTSDQVRFHDTQRDRHMPLADVPLLVFTETMRDVDLVVGVTSIGTDPEWLDRGDGRRFGTYWQDFNFGELTESATIRRQVLEQLLPRIAIADRCELEERYLHVRGDIRSYRIHLGSGNVLMSPNDQYLCIVAARDRRAGKLFLPFDDDPVLSVILSKAFMLAEDVRVKDPTIVRQINGSQSPR